MVKPDCWRNDWAVSGSLWGLLTNEVQVQRGSSHAPVFRWVFNPPTTFSKISATKPVRWCSRWHELTQLTRIPFAFDEKIKLLTSVKRPNIAQLQVGILLQVSEVQLQPFNGTSICPVPRRMSNKTPGFNKSNFPELCLSVCAQSGCLSKTRVCFFLKPFPQTWVFSGDSGSPIFSDQWCHALMASDIPWSCLQCKGLSSMQTKCRTLAPLCWLFSAIFYTT